MTREGVKVPNCFSALQRAEIAEIDYTGGECALSHRFSALQRAEIAEIGAFEMSVTRVVSVSVLFNEPKLLKSLRIPSISAAPNEFQCSSTSRNC